MENLMIAKTDDPNVILAQLNAATGYSQIPVFPLLKFNAEDGEWLKETAEKDTENKPIYESIGKEIKLHIILTRKMVQSGFDVKPENKVFSREFQGSFVELYNSDKQMVLSGQYQTIKQANPDLMWIQVIYGYVDGQPYRIKLSGSKLTKWFPYYGSFKNDNPARYLTVASCGAQVKNGAVKYYELNFTKGEPVDLETVVKRVNDINHYLAIYNQAKNKIEAGVITDKPEEPPMIEEPEGRDMEVKDEDISNIPF